MRFKSDVGSSPPPFKRVVRLMAHCATYGGKNCLQYLKEEVSESLRINLFQKGFLQKF